MPRRTNSVPRYCHHKPSGQAVVTLNGKRIYLGKWNTKAELRQSTWQQSCASAEAEAGRILHHAILR